MKAHKLIGVCSILAAMLGSCATRKTVQGSQQRSERVDSSTTFTQRTTTRGADTIRVQVPVYIHCDSAGHAHIQPMQVHGASAKSQTSARIDYENGQPVLRLHTTLPASEEQHTATATRATLVRKTTNKDRHTAKQQAPVRGWLLAGAALFGFWFRGKLSSYGR